MSEEYTIEHAEKHGKIEERLKALERMRSRIWKVIFIAVSAMAAQIAASMAGLI